VSALRISTPTGVAFVDLGPCPHVPRVGYIGGHSLSVARSGDDQGAHGRSNAYPDEPPRKRITEARRTNNREAARRYRARHQARAV
jgi:hypothetical protein